MGVITSTRPSTNQARESRALTFVQPLIGAHLQALTDQTAGDIDTSLRNQVVWACVHLIASCMAMMPPYAYRGGVQGFGASNRIPDQPVILNVPSADADIMDFIYMGMMSLLLRGNIYALVADVDKAGRILQLELQHPDQVHVKQLDNGRVEYRVRNKLVDPSLMWHKKGYRIPGKVAGLSPIQYAASTIRLDLNARSFGSRYFEDGGHPSGMITNENTDLKTINPDDAVTIKARFMAAIRGSREPVVMGGGWKYQPIQIKPDESQFLDTQKWTATDICRAFNVDPVMVAASIEGSSVTYANVENRMLDFLVRTMTWWITRWERWLGDELPRGQYVKFDDRALLKTDLLSRLRAYHLMAASNCFDPDEIRAAEDLPPLTPEQIARIKNIIAQPVKLEGQSEV